VITAVAGGVGAARLLRGLVRVVPPTSVTAVVNTGDDTILHGLHVSPDLDTVVYTLAGRADEVRGWGLQGESWTVMQALEELGGEAWFRLGDRDLATHLYRTQRLSQGAALSEVTAELTRAMGVGARVLPMSDAPVRTRLRLATGEDVDFQEYFVRRGHAVAVAAVRYEGADEASPGPGVLAALAEASRIVICPSNPILSIGPILAVAGVADTLMRRRDDVVAVSPIVAGAAIKGPADRLLAELGHESSVVGVARIWAPWAATLVVDEVDAALAEEVEEVGMQCLVAPTIMSSLERATALASVVVDGVG
jgi:LPPG:FO 2-phospho-L-lactate transferase